MHGPVPYASLLSTTTKRTSLALSTYSMLWMALHRSFAQNVPATTFEEARCCSSAAIPILSCPNKLPLHLSAGCPGGEGPVTVISSASAHPVHLSHCLWPLLRYRYLVRSAHKRAERSRGDANERSSPCLKS